MEDKKKFTKERKRNWYDYAPLTILIIFIISSNIESINIGDVKTSLVRGAVVLFFIFAMQFEFKIRKNASLYVTPIFFILVGYNLLDSSLGYMDYLKDIVLFAFYAVSVAFVFKYVDNKKIFDTKTARGFRLYALTVVTLGMLISFVFVYLRKFLESVLG